MASFDGLFDLSRGHSVRVAATRKLRSQEKSSQQASEEMLDVGPLDYGTTEQFELAVGQLREARRVVEWHGEPNGRGSAAAAS